MTPETLFPTLFGRPFGLAGLLRPDDGAGGGGGGSGGGDGDGDAGSGGTGDAAAGGTGDTGTGNGNGNGGDDLAAVRRELEQTRKEAAKHRRELQALRQANESAEERRERELAEAREAANSSTSTVRTLRVENAVLRRASSLGIVDPDAAARLLELPEDAWKEDGAVDESKVDAALRALIKGKPYLVRQGSAAAGDGGAGNRGGEGQVENMNTLLRRAAGRVG